jgi:hypothetical protein
VNYQSRDDKKNVRACYRCGNQSHLANKCPHINKTCSTCKKDGHLSSVCRLTRVDNKQAAEPKKNSRKKKFKKKSGVVHFNDEQNEELEFNSDWMCSVLSADFRRQPPYIQ